MSKVAVMATSVLAHGAHGAPTDGDSRSPVRSRAATDTLATKPGSSTRTTTRQRASTKDSISTTTCASTGMLVPRPRTLAPRHSIRQISTINLNILSRLSRPCRLRHGRARCISSPRSTGTISTTASNSCVATSRRCRSTITARTSLARTSTRGLTGHSAVRPSAPNCATRTW